VYGLLSNLEKGTARLKGFSLMASFEPGRHTWSWIKVQHSLRQLDAPFLEQISLGHVTQCLPQQSRHTLGTPRLGASKDGGPRRAKWMYNLRNGYTSA